MKDKGKRPMIEARRWNYPTQCRLSLRERLPFGSAKVDRKEDISLSPSK